MNYLKLLCAIEEELFPYFEHQISTERTSNMIEFTEIDKLVLAKPKETYEELKKIYDSNEQLRNNINLLWRLGRACFLWANSLQKKDPRKKSLIHEGLILVIVFFIK
ncbi:unnamed protein product [Thelazia callipaeda]|uniref:Uncharacterized protein n=1 Tax=Thelazia callipaeda TaxID=103827 RepID=A0A0N5DBK0_THECL|nr:unnamed protein product [Thelazia callipaeda]